MPGPRQRQRWRRAPWSGSCQKAVREQRGHPGPWRGHVQWQEGRRVAPRTAIRAPRPLLGHGMRCGDSVPLRGWAGNVPVHACD